MSGNKRRENNYAAPAVKRALIHFLAGKSLGMVLALVWVLTLVRTLHRDEYGIYMIFLSFLEIFLLSTSIGLMPILERYVPELRALNDIEKLGNLIRTLIIIRALSLVLFCVIALSFSRFITSNVIDVPRAQDSFLFFCGILFFEGMARFLDSINESLLLQRLSQIAALIRNSLKAGSIVSIWYAVGSIDLITWVRVELACAALGFVVTLAISMCSRRSTLPSGSLRIGFAAADMRRYARYAIPAFTAQLIWLGANIDSAKIITANYFDLAVSARFGFVVSIAWMIQRYLPTILLGGVIKPLFVDASTKSDFARRMVFLSKVLIRLNMFVSLPMVVFAFFFGNQVLALVSGGKFTGDGILFSILLGYVLTQTVRSAYSMTAAGIEDGVASLGAGLISCATFGVGVVLAGRVNFLLIPVSLVIGDILAISFVSYRVRLRGVMIDFPWASAIKLLIAGAMSSFFVYFSKVAEASVWLDWLVCVVIFVGVYLICAYFLRVFSEGERNAINKILPLKVFLW